jgi:hypothetical protein
MKLIDIRYILERELSDSIDNDTIIHWMNEGQSDFGLSLYISAPTVQIPVNTTDLSFLLPVDLKQIHRLSLQSDASEGKDQEYKGKYRIFNGKIIFPTPFYSADTLLLDYYKTMKFFVSIDAVIDIADRFTSIYTAYGKMRYYLLPRVAKQLGAQARQMVEIYQSNYLMLKKQVNQEYALQNPYLEVEERW